jgi:hypothetical protein
LISLTEIKRVRLAAYLDVAPMRGAHARDELPPEPSPGLQTLLRHCVVVCVSSPQAEQLLRTWRRDGGLTFEIRVVGVPDGNATSQRRRPS